MSERTVDPPASSVRIESPAVPRWVKGLGPLLLLALLVAGFIRFGPVGVFLATFPPVEELTIQRISLRRRTSSAFTSTNGGPEAVTVAQVLVDDASWVHRIDGDPRIGRLESRTLTVPTRGWREAARREADDQHGLTFTAEVAVATRTPAPDARYLGTFALLGSDAGVIPVFLGCSGCRFCARSRARDALLPQPHDRLADLPRDRGALEAVAEAGRVTGAFNGRGLVLLALSERRSP